MGDLRAVAHHTPGEGNADRPGNDPGVVLRDIHSPRVPALSEVTEALRLASKAVPAERLWVNPDCGLKTRGYAEVRPALAPLGNAARQLRTEVGDWAIV